MIEMTNFCKLNELPLKTTAVITDIDGGGAFKRRLSHMGITEGSAVTPLFSSPFGDPTAYLVKGCVIALRKTDCAGIAVRVEEET